MHDPVATEAGALDEPRRLVGRVDDRVVVDGLRVEPGSEYHNKAGMRRAHATWRSASRSALAAGCLERSDPVTHAEVVVSVIAIPVAFLGCSPVTVLENDRSVH